MITPQKNLWHCMGACQVGGSVIDWVMRAESVSFLTRSSCCVMVLRRRRCPPARLGALDGHETALAVAARGR